MLSENRLNSLESKIGKSLFDDSYSEELGIFERDKSLGRVWRGRGEYILVMEEVLSE